MQCVRGPVRARVANVQRKGIETESNSLVNVARCVVGAGVDAADLLFSVSMK